MISHNVAAQFVSCLLLVAGFCQGAEALGGDLYKIVLAEAGRSGCSNETHLALETLSCSEDSVGLTLRPANGTGTTWQIAETASGKDGFRTVQFLAFQEGSSDEPVCPKKRSILLNDPLVCKSTSVVAAERDGEGNAWELVPINDQPGIFNIRSKVRKLGCMRYLTAPKSCSKSVQVSLGGRNPELRHWKLEKIDALASVPPTMPIPSPSAPPDSATPPPVLPTSSPPPIPMAATVPDMPTHVEAYASHSSNPCITVTWTAPASDGGNDITSYHVTCTSNGGAPIGPIAFPGDQMTTGANGMCNLLVDVPYRCTVTAVNSVGESIPSLPSGEVLILYEDVDCSHCPSGQYISTPCSASKQQNRICTACTICGENFYALQACGINTDTLCRICKTCIQYKSVCTPTQDAECIACFPANSLVYVAKSTQKVAIKDLTVGDQVLSIDPSLGTTIYSPIYVFPHAVESGTHPFKKISTSSNATITISSGHYIYVSNPRFPGEWAHRVSVLASEVSAGDGMWMVPAPGEDMRWTRVTSVIDVLEEGIYAPFTVTGTIVVGSADGSDGVVSSVYDESLNSEFAMHLFCGWGRWLWYRVPSFFVYMHARGWASPVAQNIRQTASVVLSALSFI